jgi:DNA-binding NarL/FixJ family response regulator
MDKISVFIVDDHEIMRDGVRALLIGTNIKVLSDFSNPQEMFERLNHQTADVILMDINMPVMTGIEALDILQKKHPEIPVLMFSAETDEHSIRKAVKKGAMGFLPKDSSQEELVDAIQTVVMNQNYFGNSILSVIFKGYVSETQKKHKSAILSDREIQIIRLICDGMSYKEMGAELFISPRTVESQKQTIFKKLELDNNAHLIKYAIKNGIVDLD